MIVNIVTINKNNYQGLVDTLESIREVKSDYLFLNLYVIDGCSSDKSLSVLQNNTDIITYYISETDDGISDAFNKGI